MTTSTTLVAIDNKVDDALKHYGVKGMKWGKRKADTEYKPTPTSGGGGYDDDDDYEADLREFQELNEYMETIFRPNAGPIDYDKFNEAVRRLNEIEARMTARNERLEKENKEKGLPRVRDNRPSSDRVPTPTKNPGKTFKEDITTEELLKRRKRALRQSDDIDAYLMHYGVKGMKWGVRKDRKTGRVKSVARRTPLMGKNETGNVRNAVDNAPGGKSNHKAVRRAYLDARVPIKQGLRNINNDDRFKGKDLTNEKSKLVKQYHKEISEMVTEKLAMSAIIKSRKNDKVIPKLDYDMSKSSEPQLSELRSKNQYDQPGIKNVARQVRDRDMNTTDKVIRVAKRGAVTAAAYTAASHAIGAGIVGAMLLETLYGESTPSMIRGLNDSSSDLIRKEMEKSLRQSDEDQVTVVFDPILDDLGHILDVEFDVVSDTVTHDEMSLDDYLIHYGVKGMKWGVRKDGKPQGYQGGGGSKSKSKKKKKSSDGGSNPLSKLSSATKTKIKNVADPNRRAKKKIERTKRKAEVAEAQAEAEARVAAAEKKAAEARKATELTRTATTASSGSGSLSDKELKAVVERMNLEKQYAKHMSDAKPKKMSTTLVNIAKETAIDFAKQKVRSEINKSLGKSYDKFFDAFSGNGSKPSGTSESKPRSEPKSSKPWFERKTAPKGPPPRTETRTQPTATPRSTPRPQDFIARPALPSPPRPSQRALPGPGPSRPSSGGTSARLKSDPTVQKFGKVSMEQIRAYNEGRRYRPFDPRRRR